MKPKSNAARYLEEECPALLKGTSSERAHALTSWAEHHQGRAGIYKRIALVVALTFVFWSNRDFICALTSKPISLKKIKVKTAVRVFMVAVNNYGAAPTRAQQQSTSRDVRAVLYLLAKKIPPNEVCDLAKRNGEGVHAWATEFTQKKRGRKIARAAKRAQIEPEGSILNEVKISIKIGGGKTRYFKRAFPRERIDGIQMLVEDFMEDRNE